MPLSRMFPWLNLQWAISLVEPMCSLMGDFIPIQVARQHLPMAARKNIGAILVLAIHPQAYTHTCTHIWTHAHTHREPYLFLPFWLYPLLPDLCLFHSGKNVSSVPKTGKRGLFLNKKEFDGRETISCELLANLFPLCTSERYQENINNSLIE